VIQDAEAINCLKLNATEIDQIDKIVSNSKIERIRVILKFQQNITNKHKENSNNTKLEKKTLLN
jgi:hypothetical protein